MEREKKSSGAAAERQELVEQLLALVERSIGRGETLPESEWEALRARAAGSEKSLGLVARLEQVIDACARALEQKRAEGVDVTPLRSGIVAFVQRTVSEGSAAEPGGSAVDDGKQEES